MSQSSWVVLLEKETDENQKDDVLSLPEVIYNCYQPTKTNITFGLWTFDVHCTFNTSSNTVKLSPSLFDQLGINQGISCNLRIENNTIHLGPVIGIFTSRRYIQQLSLQLPSFRSTEIEKANHLANTILYYFCINDIDGKQLQIRGTYYDPRNKKWRLNTFPFPNVLYDRRSGRVSTTNKRHRQIGEELKKLPIKKINSVHYFDKLDLHQTLHKDEEVRDYLPVTKPYKKLSDLANMMKQSQAVYIKSCIGSMGKRVMRIEKGSRKGYICSFYTDRLVQQRVNSLRSAHRIIRFFFSEDKVLIQRAINLLQFHGGNIDMRATVQRNGKGELEINSITVRLGQINSPITSTRSGSKVLRFEDFLKRLTWLRRKKIQQLKARVETFLFTIYTRIEQSYGTFGEMGIDFGLDKKGRIWFIESNAKPAKDSLYQSFDRKTIQSSFLNPLKYAKYASGFSIVPILLSDRKESRLSAAQVDIYGNEN